MNNVFIQKKRESRNSKALKLNDVAFGRPQRRLEMMNSFGSSCWPEEFGGPICPELTLKNKTAVGWSRPRLKPSALFFFFVPIVIPMERFNLRIPFENGNVWNTPPGPSLLLVWIHPKTEFRYFPGTCWMSPFFRYTLLSLRAPYGSLMDHKGIAVSFFFFSLYCIKKWVSSLLIF